MIGYSDGLNLYGYAAASPELFSDPLGLRGRTMSAEDREEYKKSFETGHNGKPKSTTDSACIGLSVQFRDCAAYKEHLRQEAHEKCTEKEKELGWCGLTDAKEREDAGKLGIVTWVPTTFVAESAYFYTVTESGDGWSTGEFTVGTDSVLVEGHFESTASVTEEAGLPGNVPMRRIDFPSGEELKLVGYALVNTASATVETMEVSFNAARLVAPKAISRLGALGAMWSVYSNLNPNSPQDPGNLTLTGIGGALSGTAALTSSAPLGGAVGGASAAVPLGTAILPAAAAFAAGTAVGAIANHFFPEDAKKFIGNQLLEVRNAVVGPFGGERLEPAW